MRVRCHPISALVAGAAIALCEGPALAQQSPQGAPSRAAICDKLTAGGLPQSTVKTYYKAMQSRLKGTASPTPEQKAGFAADIVRQLPVPLVVGVVEFIGTYHPQTGEVGRLNFYVLRARLESAVAGYTADDVIEIDRVEGEDKDATHSVYWMTVVANVKYDQTGKVLPGQPRAISERWNKISLSGDSRTSIPGGETSRLHLVIAGTPRPPFTGENLFESRPVCQGCGLETRRTKIVHVDPVCAAIVNARTGQTLYVIQ